MPTPSVMAVFMPRTRGCTRGRLCPKRIQSNSARGQAARTLEAPGGLVTLSALGHDKHPPTGLLQAWVEDTGEAVEPSLRGPLRIPCP